MFIQNTGSVSRWGPFTNFHIFFKEKEKLEAISKMDPIVSWVSQKSQIFKK